MHELQQANNKRTPRDKWRERKNYMKIRNPNELIILQALLAKLFSFFLKHRFGIITFFFLTSLYANIFLFQFEQIFIWIRKKTSDYFITKDKLEKEKLILGICPSLIDSLDSFILQVFPLVYFSCLSFEAMNDSSGLKQGQNQNNGGQFLSKKSITMLQHLYLPTQLHRRNQVCKKKKKRIG